jgi:UDP-3-O-[3-hydroxymyristoyl] glucosamine N-acyltransferase
MPTLTTGDLARRVSAELIGRDDLRIDGLEAMEAAGPSMLTFIRSGEYARRWPTSRACAALVTRGIDVPGHDASTKALLVVPDADLAMISCLELFALTAPPITPGRHPTAVVDATAMVDATAVIGPWCVIEAGASVGAHVRLGPHVVIGRDAHVGAGTVLHSGVSIGERCIVGRGCIFWSGVVIGADGFGFRLAPDGRCVVKIPHIGNVIIGDGVEIGANSCIDRGKFGSTRLGDGCKIDNLVQIGHNCQLGRSCLIAGQSGVGGSTIMGDGCIVGGKVGITDNLHIGPGVRIGANSGVSGHVPARETIFGYPAARLTDMRRVVAAWHKLPKLLERVRELERRAGLRGKPDQGGPA